MHLTHILKIMNNQRRKNSNPNSSSSSSWWSPCERIDIVVIVIIIIIIVINHRDHYHDDDAHLTRGMIDCRWFPLDPPLAVQCCLRCQRHLKVPVRAGHCHDDHDDHDEEEGGAGDDNDECTQWMFIDIVIVINSMTNMWQEFIKSMFYIFHFPHSCFGYCQTILGSQDCEWMVCFNNTVNSALSTSRNFKHSLHYICGHTAIQCWIVSNMTKWIWLIYYII